MRKFFPFSRRRSEFYEFHGFSNDIILVVFEQCSPRDLLHLSMTCKHFQELIRAHQFLWEVALVNVSGGGCPRVPALPKVTAKGNYTHEAYAQFIFGGGICSRPSCNKNTNTNPFHPLVGQPYDFLFRFRACSSRCKKQIEDNGVIQDVTRKRDNAEWGNWLPRELSDDSEPFYMYARKAVEEAEEERRQAEIVDSGEVRFEAKFPIRSGIDLDKERKRRARSHDAIQQNATLLLKWQKLYLSERERVSRLNSDFVQKMASSVNKKATGIKRTPTMGRLLDAFNRDLAPLTFTIWRQNRTAILEELESISQGAFPAGVTIHRHEKVRCPHCLGSGRRFKAQILAIHIIDKHPGIDPSTLGPAVVPKGKRYCLECPGSHKLYAIHDLQKHKETAHSS
ncbi:hypothetical protein FB45DRAFT_889579 [Roridomyces roridus]|uniref:F-box domain-containing protein n=1 Tax=Roridomyces roridus TaxID=1738132 RepID=A0AAD7CKM2_9AGAR|nr:hypothetical protein FB45DRAFT_889579 [Roridomyces roridus]